MRLGIQPQGDKGLNELEESPKDESLFMEWKIFCRRNEGNDPLIRVSAR